MATSQTRKSEVKKGAAVSGEVKAGEVKMGAAAADASEVKRKLAWRMGLAGLMIVALLGGLALFDRFSAPAEPESSAPEFTEPVPVAKKLITQPVTPVELTPEPVKEVATEPSQAPATADISAPPVDKAAPRAERPARPEVAAQPALPRATPPAARPAASQAPAQSPAQAQAKPAAAMPARAAEPAVATMPPTPPRLFSGYALQAGVFSELHRAEELHARLVLEGIPATIEARVQVGPFANRAEAEAARAKMKAMGVDSVMLLPKGVKR